MQQQKQPESSSRAGLKHTGGGVIVEVQGGHIVRSIGRKDRHSKVCTAKGPRDRRLRLSAHTAIQFYDVQDRLGYDRPSKAVDWLITKAKTSIEKLAELPAWNPTTGSISTNTFSTAAITSAEQSFLPPSLDSDAIADTMGASAEASSATMRFQNYPQDLFSRSNSQNHQDLRLSLQSFQDPMLIQSHQHHHQNQTNQGEEHALFPFGFDSLSADWSEQQQQQQPFLQQLFGQSQFFSQRGTLQSSNTSSIRAWIDSPIMTDHHHHQTPSIHSGIGGFGEFSGFLIPARIQDGEEHDDGVSNKPLSSASSDSRQ